MLIVSSSRNFVGAGCVCDPSGEDPHILVKIAHTDVKRNEPFRAFRVDQDNQGNPVETPIGTYEVINDDLDDEVASMGGFLKNIVIRLVE
jgi:hypothetical protein